MKSPRSAGVAYSDTGRARSGMGLDSADFDNDGWMGLFVANLDREMFAMYKNNHDETFDDVALSTGIGKATKFMSGWGLKFLDYDNDGNLDLMLANGNPDDLIATLHGEVTYEEPLLLFHNSGKSLENVSAQSGPVFAKPLSARGMAIGDFNNDGAVDVLLRSMTGRPFCCATPETEPLARGQSCRKEIESRRHWGPGYLSGRRSQANHMKVGGGSYLSSHDPRMVLGIGQRKKIDWLEVKWPQPSGTVERFTDLPIDRYVTIVEGQGKWK